MAERFERLFGLPYNLYSDGSPVIVSAGALLKDTKTGNVVVQLKYQSISATPIKALKIEIIAFDVAGKEIGDITEYQYLDLNIRNGQSFGSNKAIVMPDSVTRSFAICGIKVIFDNGTVQDVVMPISALSQARSLQTEFGNAELVKQYQLATNEKAVYVPQEINTIWQCTCGEWNGATNCTTCGISKVTAFSAFNAAELTEKLKNRLAKEKAEREAKAEQDRIAAEEEAIRLAAKAEQNKATMKKIKVAAAIIIPFVAVVLLFSLWLYPDVIRPNTEYGNAQELLANGQYDDAITAFAALGDFRDSAEMVNESFYQKANSLLDDQKYDDAISIFESLVEYKDSADKIKEANYLKALSMFETGDIEEAIAILEGLGGYADSQSYLEILYYQYAGKLLEQGSYDEAKVIYQSIEDYEDSSGMVLECDYRKATALFYDGKYEDALDIFLQITGYEDADNQVLSCQYHLALTKMEASHYSDAIELLEELGDYKDAADLLIEAKYQLAKHYTSYSDYETATALFNEVGNYKDATTYIQLISETKSMVFQTHDNFQYWYLWVRIDVDVDNCSLKVFAKIARSNDLVNIGEQKYSIDYLWQLEEWKYENGKYLMVFLGSNPTEDKTSYREWTVGPNWGTIRSQSMLCTGEILGDPGEYVDNYTRITDEKLEQRLIERFQNYRGN